MREYSIPAMVEVPAAASLADVVFTRAESQPHAVMMRRLDRDGGWHDVTAGQFRDEVAALAKGLVAAGIEPGDRVALMSRTRYEWTLIDYAIWTAGAVTVPVYETSSIEQIEWILSDSGASAAFAETPAHADAIRQAEVAAVAHVWVIEGPDGLVIGPDAASVTDEQLDQRRMARTAADLATIIYTSGTTGRPKGCEITHGNLLSDVRNAVAGSLVEVFEIAGSSTLLFLPLAHSFARIIQVGCLESGAILGHWPDTGTVAAALPEFRPTFLLAVPRVFEKVYNTASSRPRRARRRAGSSTPPWPPPSPGARPSAPAAPARRPGAPAAPRPVRPARLRQAPGRGRRAGGVRGLRRRPARRAARPLLPRRRHHDPGGLRADRDLGRGHREPAQPQQDRHRRPAAARRRGQDRRGRRDPAPRARTSSPATGTTRRPPPRCSTPRGGCAPATSAAWTSEGFLRVTGRKKELIVTAGGKNVAPAVLEDRLRASPLISQCVVVGDGRPYIACLITLDAEGAGVLEAAARAGRRRGT